MGKLTKGKAILGVLLTALMVCALLVPAVAVADDGNWSQFHNDVANTGYTTSGAPDTNDLAWVSADIGATSASSVVVANSKVFVNCGDHLPCLEESNGTTLWSRPIEGSGTSGSWISPAYDDGKVFISGAKVYCFSENGSPAEWTYNLPFDASNAGPAVAAGKVFASAWNTGGPQGHGYYYCLNESNGGELWSFEVPGYAQGVPAYASGNVYLTSWEYVGGNVYCVDANTGQEIWHTFWDQYDEKPMDWDTCGSPCVADGKVFVTTYNFYGYGELIALNAADGSLVWGPVEIERADSTPAYADGKLYVSGGCFGFSSEGERTYCFDATNGNLIWRTAVGIEPALNVGNWTCSVAVADGKVFVGKPVQAGAHESFDYEAIYALDAADGSEIWHYDHGGASPAVANSKVFTIGEGKVCAFGSITYPDWDVNCDGDIDTQDIVLVGMHWGQTGDPGWIREDVNNDGDIDTQDIVVIGMHWGE